MGPDDKKIPGLSDESPRPFAPRLGAAVRSPGDCGSGAQAIDIPMGAALNAVLMAVYPEAEPCLVS